MVKIDNTYDLNQMHLFTRSSSNYILSEKTLINLHYNNNSNEILESTNGNNENIHLKNLGSFHM
jgi:hypothetical protein